MGKVASVALDGRDDLAAFGRCLRNRPMAASDQKRWTNGDLYDAAIAIANELCRSTDYDCRSRGVFSENGHYRT